MVFVESRHRSIAMCGRWSLESVGDFIASLHKERCLRFVPFCIKSAVFRLTFLPTMLLMLAKSVWEVCLTLLCSFASTFLQYLLPVPFLHLLEAAYWNTMLA